MQEGLLPDHCRGEKHAEVRVAAPTRASWFISRHLNKQKKNLICEDARTHLNSFPSTKHFTPLPLTTLPPSVSFTIWNLSKLGQPNCLSVRSIYFTRTLGEGPNLHPIPSNLEPLILLCSALAGSCTPVWSVPPCTHISRARFTAEIYFYVDSWSSSSL